MDCVSPVRLKHLPVSEFPDGLLVPCGRCLLCRIAKRREWTVRLLHESSLWESCCFVTITYDEDNIPEKNGLVKKDLQDFFKRLRYDIEMEGRKIKYFACGEYGEKTNRPHYHAIIFGEPCSNGEAERIRRLWNKGFVKVGIVEKDSIDYVARYIDKKWIKEFVNGSVQEVCVVCNEQKEEKVVGGRKRYNCRYHPEPFMICSQGLGLGFVEGKGGDFMRRELHIRVKGKPMAIPRYYVKKELVDKEKLGLYAEEKEKDSIESFTGIYASDMELYKARVPEGTKWTKKQRAEGIQRQKNKLAKARLKEPKL